MSLCGIKKISCKMKFFEINEINENNMIKRILLCAAMR